ncbi:flagellar motor switch phosphatase FliY [Peribacillus loiseleuriae]|uniref:Flagellar motor switch protein FliN n=1 Tax=Peribacillus loiseleuriae TaxID=1679170 RepID=A0A0K9GT64_9BACI|nr:flagellar motor switch phosphatase FliY [Peribacillus loiseleuriae]KMY49457.1 flagellar motor switch protein FliN [Peribacillus loiseleuriae]
MVGDGMLSQDEIDALLKGTDDQLSKKSEPQIDEYLSFMEQDALGEIGNISFGSSATALSTLLNQKVDITTPTVTMIEKSKLAEEFPHPYVAIQVNYTEGFSGGNLLVIQQSDAAIIADLMLGGTGVNIPDMLDEIQLSAVQEAMNQMMGSAATSMSTVFSKRVDISPPSLELINFIEGQGGDAIPDDDLIVRISFRLLVGNLIDSNIMQLLPLKFAKELVAELLNPAQPVPDSYAYQEEATQTNHTQEPVEQGYYSEHTNSQTQQPGSVPTPSYHVPQQSGPQHLGSGSHAQPVNVQPASFTSFQNYQMQESEAKNLDMLLDIPLQVTVELGRTKRSIKEILELSSGSIVELDKLAGEPVDILVNNRLIAQGEVVVIDENFGVRVTDIVSQTDRLKKLR